MNYYEGTIVNDISNLLAYPTNEEIYLAIHEAHEQATAFAKILEFIEYETLFCDEFFNTYMLTYECVSSNSSLF